MSEGERVYTTDDLVTVSASPDEKLNALLVYLEARLENLNWERSDKSLKIVEAEMRRVWNR